ncbi:hypothetical protein HU200_057783 [Digitaria exilis]|uniref:Uncharacterized protein n=1 Tax=Digitaria exilis TaxID=1010633 RepID=A0A835AEK8_9POAL|nr:hypothetical protein HU200_057783 [Digitaria exilis]
MIHRVQQHIREVDRFSYEPFVVSIGPYHHGTAALQSVEKMKWRFLDYILKLNHNKTILDYLVSLSEQAEKAKHCYSEDIQMDDEEFLRMLLLDGCFILVALGGTRGISACKQQSSSASPTQDKRLECGEPQARQEDGTEGSGAGGSSNSQEGGQSTGNDLQIGPWFIRFLNHDVLLLENQVPFFVIKKIYELVCGRESACPTELVKFVEAALRFYPKTIMESERPNNFDHLLHLCHVYFRPRQRPDDAHQYVIGTRYLASFLSFGRKYLKVGHQLDDNDLDTTIGKESDGEQNLNRWRRVVQYMEAGVSFKKRYYDRDEPHCLLDVRFIKGVMEIPCLIINEHTGSLFRNLIAFEQTCPQFGDDFTAYIVFMSQIISAPDDVTVLAQREIIVHHLESDEKVSDLFTMLSKDVVFDFNGQYYLKSLCQKMEAYYQSRLKRWMAWLWLHLFRNPWLGVAAFATVIVLICTVVQTVFGILAYIHPTG